MMTRNFLKKMPEQFNITEAMNGEVALSLFSDRNRNDSSTPFDLVVLDLQMPVMDGLECCLKMNQLINNHGY